MSNIYVYAVSVVDRYYYDDVPNLSYAVSVVDRYYYDVAEGVRK